MSYYIIINETISKFSFKGWQLTFTLPLARMKITVRSLVEIPFRHSVAWTWIVDNFGQYGQSWARIISHCPSAFIPTSTTNGKATETQVRTYGVWMFTWILMKLKRDWNSTGKKHGNDSGSSYDMLPGLSVSLHQEFPTVRAPWAA